ncbi:MAG: beta-N-acetylhexosaminidase, partial [Clostridia bacterium]
DNCPESSIWSILLGLQLYAEHGYAAEVTQETWYTRFAFCAKASGESFEALKLMDELPEVMGKDGNLAVVNTSRFLLFQDPLLGLLDANLPDGDMLERHYTALGADMTRYARDFPAHAQMFSFYASACHALALKSTLGLRLHAAYQAQDTAALCTLRDTRIPNTLHAVEALCNAHRALFLQTNKPVGWEVRDLRYGGLIQRLKTCQVRVADYLAGKTDALDELREKQLPYNGHAGLTSAYLYHDIVSASRV